MKCLSKIGSGLLLTVVLVIVIGLSIGGVIVSTFFSVTGSSKLDKVTWDVHFENVKVKKGSTSAIKPVKLDSKKTSINYEVFLERPGNYYEFSIDVVNDGKIDAKVGAEPVLSGVTGEYKDFIDYTVNYSDGSSIRVNDVLDIGTRKTIVVRIEYSKDISYEMMPEDVQSFNLGFSLDYVQK